MPNIVSSVWCQAPIFSALTKAQLEHLGQMSTYKRLDNGQVLFMEQDPCTGFYVLVEGAIQLTRATDSPSAHPTLAVIMPVNSFAEAAMFGDENFPATAIAIKHSKVYHFPKFPFLAALREDPALSLAVIHSQAVWLRKLAMKVEELSGTDSLERLRAWLRSQLQTNQDFNLPIAKKTLAAQLGMTPETLSRGLHILQEEGVLEVKGNILRRKGRI